MSSVDRPHNCLPKLAKQVRSTGFSIASTADHAVPIAWRVDEVENLWWRHWRWEAEVGQSGYAHGIALTRRKAQQKARAAVSRLKAEGHR